MKKVFIRFQYAPRTGQGTPKAKTAENGATSQEGDNSADGDKPADADGEGDKPAVVTEEPLVSEKLTELNGKKAELRAKMSAVETDADFDKLTLDIYKIGQEIRAEEATIRRDRLQAKIDEEKNIRAAMVTDMVNQLLSDNGIAPEAAVMSDAFLAQRDKVTTELLAKYGSSKPSTTANASAGTGSKGATGAEIKAALLAKLAGGGTVTDALKAIIEENNFSRGTAGAVRTAMRKAGELVQFGEKPE